MMVATIGSLLSADADVLERDAARLYRVLVVTQWAEETESWGEAKRLCIALALRSLAVHLAKKLDLPKLLGLWSSLQSQNWDAFNREDFLKLQDLCKQDMADMVRHCSGLMNRTSAWGEGNIALAVPATTEGAERGEEAELLH